MSFDFQVYPWQEVSSLHNSEQSSTVLMPGISSSTPQVNSHVAPVILVAQPCVPLRNIIPKQNIIASWKFDISVVQVSNSNTKIKVMNDLNF